MKENNYNKEAIDNILKGVERKVVEKQDGIKKWHKL